MTVSDDAVREALNVYYDVDYRPKYWDEAAIMKMRRAIEAAYAIDGARDVDAPLA